MIKSQPKANEKIGMGLYFLFLKKKKKRNAPSEFIVALVNYFKLFSRLNMKVLVLACLLSCATGQSMFPRLPTSVLLKGDQLLVTGGKIVGGTEAVPNEFPWQISLQRRSATGWSHSCGGSVYNQNYIIDAAHCVERTVASSLRIVAGEHSLSKTSGLEQYRNVLSIRVHENYNSKTSANDIALLKMDKSLDLSTAIVRPISLPTAGSILNAGTTCIVSGWGTTYHGFPLGVWAPTSAVAPSTRATGSSPLLTALTELLSDPCPSLLVNTACPSIPEMSSTATSCPKLIELPTLVEHQSQCCPSPSPRSRNCCRN
ncbi:Uncharacterized protein APZ42_018948 [Daphnia magna]|uniref:Peptidase S1 domain-containing protein n=1 Tax=Daphnia magna TaxID=35525 RepID=A0A162CQ88_9CRUS|nr:Uncharacterized protein APZ42_018948 [Daphnia magna]